MSRKKKQKNTININLKRLITNLFFLLIIIVIAYFTEKVDYNSNNIESNINNTTYSNLADLPDYNGKICVMINNNKPYFNEDDYTTKAFENYSDLDSLGRCGVAYANVCKEIMPQKGDERGNISSVIPTGWKQTKFNGEYLYNRCHLIAHSLSNEDANKQNLITGTRYFNVDGMLPIEKRVLEYINKNQNNHVLYRVTPVFKGNNLLASGVQMEAYSVEDNGKLFFNVFVYNVQPGATLNYQTGELLNN